MISYFVVSDTHSFYDELITALKNKGFQKDNPSHKLIVCGDLFDRGLQSREIFEFVKSLGDRFIYVKGNHEDLLEDCVKKIVSGENVSNHHFGNGTVRTVANICGFINDYDVAWPRRSEELKQLVYTKTRELLDFVSEKAVNYYEVGDYVFVHGWIPLKVKDLSKLTYANFYTPDFDNLEVLPREEWDNTEDFNVYQDWKDSRWYNGMQMWKKGLILPNKTIVCGHWHCSWGWSHIDQKYQEFPPKNRKKWENSFQPYKKEGIIAIDACTSYSHIVNCLRIDIEE